MSSIRVDAAFPTSKPYECYVFAGSKFMRLKYSIDTADDVILEGPKLITDRFPDLANTEFANRIDCIVAIDSSRAFIFSENKCAEIDYIEGELLQRPVLISDMFPKLTGTVFAKGIDAGINFSLDLHMFKDDHHAAINFETKHLVMEPTPIRDVFPSLKTTIFKYRFDAALPIYGQVTEAFIFQGEYYARFKFAIGADKLITDGELPILPDWPVFRALFPSQE